MPVSLGEAFINLTTKDDDLKAGLVSARSNTSTTMQSIANDVSGIGNTLSVAIEQPMDRLVVGANALAAGFGVATAALGISKWVDFGKEVVNLNAGYEQMSFKLTRLVDSSQQLKDGMAWAKDFSLQNLFGAGDTTSAMRTLLLAKRDPQTLLPQFTDTSRSTGKTLAEVANAYTGALGGSFDKLKEDLGITAGVMEDDENKIVMKFSQNGQQMHLIADNTQKSISESLLKIFSGKYTGSNDQYLGSYTGMIKSIETEWDAFKTSVGEKQNLFSGVEGSVAAVLQQIQKLRQDGTFDSLADMIAGKMKAGIDIGITAVKALGDAAFSLYARFSSYGQIAEYGLLGYTMMGAKGALVGALIGSYADQAKTAAMGALNSAYATISQHPEIAEWGIMGYAFLGAKGLAIGAVLGQFAPEITALVSSLAASTTQILSGMGAAEYGMIGYLVFGIKGAAISALLASYSSEIMAGTSDVVGTVSSALSSLGAVEYGLMGYFVFGVKGAVIAALIGPYVSSVLSSSENLFSSISSALSSISATEYGILGFVLFGISGAVAGVAFKGAIDDAKGQLNGLIDWVTQHPILLGWTVGGVKGAIAGAAANYAPRSDETPFQGIYSPDVSTQLQSRPEGLYSDDHASSLAEKVGSAVKGAISDALSVGKHPGVSDFVGPPEPPPGATAKQYFDDAINKINKAMASPGGGPKPIQSAMVGTKGAGPDIADATGGAGRGANPLDINDTFRKIQYIEAEITRMWAQRTDQQYGFWEKEASFSGRFYDEINLKNSKSLEDTMAKIGQETTKAQQDIVYLQMKLTAKRGITPESATAINLEIQKNQQLLDLNKERADIAQKTYTMDSALLDRQKLQGQVELAQTNEQTSKVTGSLQEQYDMQLKLLKAQEAAKMAGVNTNVPGLAEAYQKNFDVQEQRLDTQANGSISANFMLQFNDQLNKTSGNAYLATQMLGAFNSSVDSLSKTAWDLVANVNNVDHSGKELSKTLMALGNSVASAFGQEVMKDTVTNYMVKPVAGLLGIGTESASTISATAANASLTTLAAAAAQAAAALSMIGASSGMGGTSLFSGAFSQYLSGGAGMFGGMGFMPGASSGAGFLAAPDFAAGIDASLPFFADGGVSNSPAIFGEAGTEAAVPLPNGRSIPVNLNGQGGGGIHISHELNVHVNADDSMDHEQARQQGREIGRAITAKIDQRLYEHLRPGGILNKHLSYGRN